MKAYSVRNSYDWHILLHAETAGKVKSLFIKVFPGVDIPDYVDISAVRIPELDNLPFNLENARKAKVFDDIDMEYALYYNFCNCEICKKEK